MDIEHLGARLREALENAKAAAEVSESVFRHGAVLFRRAKIHGAGCNQYRAVKWAWPSSYKRDQSHAESEIRLNNMHAEVASMHNVKREKILGSDVFVVRLNKQGELRNSRPCKNCQKAMSRKGVRRCYFSIDESTVGVLNIIKGR